MEILSSTHYGNIHWGSTSYGKRRIHWVRCTIWSIQLLRDIWYASKIQSNHTHWYMHGSNGANAHTVILCLRYILRTWMESFYKSLCMVSLSYACSHEPSRINWSQNTQGIPSYLKYIKVIIYYISNIWLPIYLSILFFS